MLTKPPLHLLDYLEQSLSRLADKANEPNSIWKADRLLNELRAMPQWAELRAAIQATNPHPAQDVLSNPIQFPVALEKMWSGPEIQHWLDNQFWAMRFQFSRQFGSETPKSNLDTAGLKQEFVALQLLASAAVEALRATGLHSIPVANIQRMAEAVHAVSLDKVMTTLKTGCGSVAPAFLLNTEAQLRLLYEREHITLKEAVAAVDEIAKVFQTKQDGRRTYTEDYASRYLDKIKDITNLGLAVITEVDGENVSVRKGFLTYFFKPHDKDRFNLGPYDFDSIEKYCRSQPISAQLCK